MAVTHEWKDQGMMIKFYPHNKKWKEKNKQLVKFKTIRGQISVQYQKVISID